LAELSEIERLAERRRLLVSESGRCREQLAAEIRHLNGVVSWAERGYSLARALRTAWPIAGLLGGFLITSKKGFLFRAAAKGLSVWQIGKRLAPLCRRAFEAFSRRKEP